MVSCATRSPSPDDAARTSRLRQARVPSPPGPWKRDRKQPWKRRRAAGRGRSSPSGARPDTETRVQPRAPPRPQGIKRSCGRAEASLLSSLLVLSCGAMTITSPSCFESSFSMEYRCVKLWQERQNCSRFSHQSHPPGGRAFERLIWVVVVGRTFLLNITDSVLWWYTLLLGLEGFALSSKTSRLPKSFIVGGVWSFHPK